MYILFNAIVHYFYWRLCHSVETTSIEKKKTVRAVLQYYMGIKNVNTFRFKINARRRLDTYPTKAHIINEAPHLNKAVWRHQFQFPG